MDEILFKKIAEEIETEWEMGDLSDGIYYDYALEIARRYLSIQEAKFTGCAKPQASLDCKGIINKEGELTIGKVDSHG